MNWVDWHARGRGPMNWYQWRAWQTEGDIGVFHMTARRSWLGAFVAWLRVDA